MAMSMEQSASKRRKVDEVYSVALHASKVVQPISQQSSVVINCTVSSRLNKTRAAMAKAHGRTPNFPVGSDQCFNVQPHELVFRSIHRHQNGDPNLVIRTNASDYVWTAFNGLDETTIPVYLGIADAPVVVVPGQHGQSPYNGLAVCVAGTRTGFAGPEPCQVGDHLHWKFPHMVIPPGSTIPINGMIRDNIPADKCVAYLAPMSYGAYGGYQHSRNLQSYLITGAFNPPAEENDYFHKAAKLSKIIERMHMLPNDEKGFMDELTKKMATISFRMTPESVRKEMKTAMDKVGKELIAEKVAVNGDDRKWIWIPAAIRLCNIHLHRVHEDHLSQFHDKYVGMSLKSASNGPIDLLQRAAGRW